MNESVVVAAVVLAWFSGFGCAATLDSTAGFVEWDKNNTAFVAFMFGACTVGAMLLVIL